MVVLSGRVYKVVLESLAFKPLKSYLYLTLTLTETVFYAINQRFIIFSSYIQCHSLILGCSKQINTDFKLLRTPLSITPKALCWCHLIKLDFFINVCSDDCLTV